MYSIDDIDIGILKGKILSDVVLDRRENDCITFVVDELETYKLTHTQDCCERVAIESIVGDIRDLIGTPILLSEVVTQNNGFDSNYEHSTYSFYKFATIKGYVDIRWVGESNGYYSEEVNFFRDQDHDE